MANVLSRQLGLAFPSRGGVRRGAGRPRTSTRMPHTPRPRISRHVPVLVTMRARVSALRRQSIFNRIEQALSALRRRSRISQERFRITHFSIQENHIHLIIEATDRDALARGAQGLAIRIARRVNAALDRKGTFWTERYHASPLKTPRQVRNALVYVLHNRKKHGALSCAIDRMSSCFWFNGFRDLDDVRDVIMDLMTEWQTRDGPPPVTPPQSWLLQSGWRRSGLISVHEAPRLKR